MTLRRTVVTVVADQDSASRTPWSRWLLAAKEQGAIRDSRILMPDEATARKDWLADSHIVIVTMQAGISSSIFSLLESGFHQRDLITIYAGGTPLLSASGWIEECPVPASEADLLSLIKRAAIGELGPTPAAVSETATALAVWREKFDYLQKQEAIASDAVQKFTLRKQIEEAQGKVHELESLEKKRP